MPTLSLCIPTHDGRAPVLDRALAAMVGHYKLQPGHTLAGDLRLLLAMTRHYGRLAEFWTQSFPALLVPHPLVPIAVRATQALRAGMVCLRRHARRPADETTP
jgi:hypothetical protein